MAEGSSNQTIADRLFVSAGSVDQQRPNDLPGGIR
jgi:DNA-binding CsgD family transcriptional regulator